MVVLGLAGLGGHHLDGAGMLISSNKLLMALTPTLSRFGTSTITAFRNDGRRDIWWCQ